MPIKTTAPPSAKTQNGKAYTSPKPYPTSKSAKNIQVKIKSCLFATTLNSLLSTLISSFALKSFRKIIYEIKVLATKESKNAAHIELKYPQNEMPKKPAEMIFVRFENTKGKLALSLIKPVASKSASAERGGRFNALVCARIIGASISTAASFAKSAETTPQSAIRAKNSFFKSPPHARAALSAACSKKPISSSIKEKIIMPKNARLASQTMLKASSVSPKLTVPQTRLSTAPIIAQVPMPRLKGRKITAKIVSKKIAILSKRDLYVNSKLLGNSKTH